MYKYILITSCIISLYSCTSQKTQNKDQYILSAIDRKIEISIDSDTKIYTRAMHHYTDTNGIEYISIENSESIDAYNTINFYRLDSCCLSHKIKIAKEGVSGIPNFMGHGIIDLNNIFLSVSGSPVLYQIDRNGHIQKKYDYSITKEKHTCTPTDFNSLVYKPLTIVDGKIYCMQFPIPPNASEEVLRKTPLSITIDTSTNEVSSLPLSYPILWKKGTGMGLNPHCSRIYNGKQFIYAFRINENIVVTQDHIHSTSYPIKSRYIQTLVNEGYPRDLSFEDFCKKSDEQAVYGNIVYDQYRNVYYRFAYPECTTQKNTPFEYIFCRKEFSIIIIDSNFNIIGETLFPAGQYAPGLFFVNKEGLYLSENNIDNENMDENKLVFRCLKLIKIE
ncbi:DUF4221 family protein [Parabacteroides bouchesdurhonensis]|uniref:DUF4221 family protein n=1 Tax=Parabacteroides bouchesdurhonensis TaxID=1936995 RepID=UPI000E4BDAED|nr:DUF4221 family protein [Parabacteroides bouchesdurhonensis]RHJ93000.1 DUF4221 domain-containing protein [Bacteroides sp. AM07-16]